MSGLSIELAVVTVAAIVGVVALPWRAGAVRASWRAAHRLGRQLAVALGLEPRASVAVPAGAARLLEPEAQGPRPGNASLGPAPSQAVQRRRSSGSLRLITSESRHEAA